MTQVARYQPQRLFAEHEAVKTFHGLDPLTGLPVLIYTFAGKPTVKVGELKSETIPTILTSSYERGGLGGGGFERGRGQLVVAYARGYEPLGEPVQPFEVAGLLRDSATALYDAARSSVVHGDLRPARFLKANDHVMLEGYGVPWATWDAAPASGEFSPPERIGGASAKGDVFSWARSVQFLAGRHLPEKVRDLIAACLSADPMSRPSAETIYKQIAEPQTTPSTGEEASPFDALEFTPEETFSDNPFAASEARPAPQRGVVAVLSGDSAGVAAPSVRRSAAPTEATPTLADDPFGFGAVDDEGPAPKGAWGRRVALLTALLIGLLVLGTLAFFNRNAVGEAASTALDVGVSAVLGVVSGFTRDAETRGGTYLINVDIVPANARADLVVTERPAGSSLPLAQPISVAPGPAILDRTGVWQLQVQRGGQLSEIQEVRVPEERSVTFMVPWVGGRE